MGKVDGQRASEQRKGHCVSHATGREQAYLMKPGANGGWYCGHTRTASQHQRAHTFALSIHKCSRETGVHTSRMDFLTGGKTGRRSHSWSPGTREQCQCRKARCRASSGCPAAAACALPPAAPAGCCPCNDEKPRLRTCGAFTSFEYPEDVQQLPLAGFHLRILWAVSPAAGRRRHRFFPSCGRPRSLEAFEAVHPLPACRTRPAARVGCFACHA